MGVRRLIVLVLAVVVVSTIPTAASGAPGLLKLGSNMRLADLHADIDIELPAIAFNSVDGEYLAVWRDQRMSPTGAIFGQRISSAGERIDRSFQVSSTRAEGTRNPAIVFNPIDNQYLVVWRDDRHWDTRRGDIFGQRVRADGTRVGKSFRISGSNALRRDDYPAVAHNPVDNQYLVVWTDERAEITRDSDIYGQWLAADGAKVGANTRVSGANAIGDVGSPAVAHNPGKNEFLVAWIERRSARNQSLDIYASLLSADGERIGGTFRVGGNPEGSDLVPAVAYASDADQYLVVWWDENERDIVGRRVAADGTRLGAARRVSGASANADGEPAIAYEGGEYLVAWSDGRRVPGSSGIFSRHLDTTGERLGPNMRVSGAKAIEAGSIAVAANITDGEWLVAWLDFRIYDEWGLQLYGQRLGRVAE